MHTCIHAYRHTCIHAYIPTYLHTYIPTYLHTYIPTYLHTYIPTYLHTYIPTYVHTYIPTYLHTYIPTYLHTCIPTYLHTYIRTYVHLCIRTHTHIYIYLYMQSMAPVERSSPYPASCQGEGLRIPKSVRVILRKKRESSSRWNYHREGSCCYPPHVAEIEFPIFAQHLQNGVFSLDWSFSIARWYRMNNAQLTHGGWWSTADLILQKKEMLHSRNRDCLTNALLHTSRLLQCSRGMNMFRTPLFCSNNRKILIHTSYIPLDFSWFPAAVTLGWDSI